MLNVCQRAEHTPKYGLLSMALGLLEPGDMEWESSRLENCTAVLQGPHEPQHRLQVQEAS